MVEDVVDVEEDRGGNSRRSFVSLRTWEGDRLGDRSEVRLHLLCNSFTPTSSLITRENERRKLES